MTNLIDCVKLKRKAESLSRPPFPGELGQRIFQNISKEAWDMWVNHQTMLINEYRLNTLDASARLFLRKEMENFLFGDGSAPPPDFVPNE